MTLLRLRDDRTRRDLSRTIERGEGEQNDISWCARWWLWPQVPSLSGRGYSYGGAIVLGVGTWPWNDTCQAEERARLYLAEDLPSLAAREHVVHFRAVIHHS